MNAEARIYRIGVVALLLLASVSVATGQQIDRDQIVAQLNKDGCVQLDQRKLKFCRVDYVAGGWRVDAIAIYPLTEGRYPGLLLLPGFEGTSKTLLGIGALFAQQGFACLAVTPPGVGDSGGKRDFMGPASIDAFAVGFRNFARDPSVDSKKMGIFGYSRGGMAASLLTVKLEIGRAHV